MKQNKIGPGSVFPKIFVSDQTGERINISKIKGEASWKLICVFRGGIALFARDI